MDLKKYLRKDSDIIIDEFEDRQNYELAITPPIYLTSLHTFNNMESYLGIPGFETNQYVYGRTANPTTHILERKLAALERGTYGYAFASGQAASCAAIHSVCPGDSHIICMANVYGCVKAYLDNILPVMQNITVTYLSGEDMAEFQQSITKNTKLIILESPSTFKNSVVDIRKITDLAKQYNILTYIDNTYCTPIFQKPLELGCDIVMHTLSKYIGGHSDIIGGVLVVKDEELAKKIEDFRGLNGGIIGPMEGWLALRGLRTLIPRMIQHQKTTLSVAEFLEQSDKVEKVYYTGLSSHPNRETIQKQQMGHTGLMSFVLKTQDDKKIMRFVNQLRLFKIGCSWGGYESLVLMPLYNNTEKELQFMGLEKRLIRIHCGLDLEENLLQDIEIALNCIED